MFLLVSKYSSEKLLELQEILIHEFMLHIFWQASGDDKHQ